MGHFLISSLAQTSPQSSAVVLDIPLLFAFATSNAPFSEQERPECQVAEQREQNSFKQDGQETGTPLIIFNFIILKF